MNHDMFMQPPRNENTPAEIYANIVDRVLDQAISNITKNPKPFTMAGIIERETCLNEIRVLKSTKEIK